MPCQTLTQYAGTGPMQKHHCTFCAKPASDRCLKKGHVAYCEVEECKRLFNVQTHTGCNEHKYRDGFNIRYKRNSSDDQTAYEKQQERFEAEAAERERQEGEELARRAEVDYDKDWKKEDRKRAGKVPKVGKKELKKCGRGDILRC
ncbi:hypothetical protein P171DRAFT_438989 [Karstenula rhodostoma CBS 690.94]|uniref:Uncharacterized protein n=1 Tax=Karstenula rhodostoma CBS 690.94 TaxID=1392251 RepID=A0A9P4UII0_9PLEO|nr:hypothetical protein P171DRAFT_438989 [Karstenula rhodostoma CBS 690.94]